MGPQGTMQSNATAPGMPPSRVPARPQAAMEQGPNNQDLNPINFMEQPMGGGKIDGDPNQYMFGEEVLPDVAPRMGYVSGQVGNSGMRAEYSGRQGLNTMTDQMPATPSEMYPQMEGNYFMQAAQEKLMRNSPDGMPPTEVGLMGPIGSPTNLGQMPDPPVSMETLPLQGMPNTDLSSPDPMGMVPGSMPVQMNSPKQRKKGKK